MSKCRQSDPPKCFPKQARKTMNFDEIYSMSIRCKAKTGLPVATPTLPRSSSWRLPTYSAYNAFSFGRTCLTAPASKRVQSHSDLISVFPPGRLLTGYLATFAVGSQGPSDDQTSSTSEYPLRPRTKRPKRSRSRNIVHNIIFCICTCEI